METEYIGIDMAKGPEIISIAGQGLMSFMMRWKDRDDYRGNWHKWFAWTPVFLDGEWVWLEMVMRKESEIYCGYGQYITEFEFKELEE